MLVFSLALNPKYLSYSDVGINTILKDVTEANRATVVTIKDVCLFNWPPGKGKRNIGAGWGGFWIILNSLCFFSWQNEKS